VPAELAGMNVRCVPASELAAELGSGFANVVMLGAVAAALGEPPLASLEDAAADQLGRKTSADDVRSAVRKGHACLS
jgi:Pyruvate/2-oxoacid:ferredoxin oxidoreductase gamma subunit